MTATRLSVHVGNVDHCASPVLQSAKPSIGGSEHRSRQLHAKGVTVIGAIGRPCSGPSVSPQEQACVNLRRAILLPQESLQNQAVQL